MDVYALLYSTKKWGPHAREIGVCGYGYGYGWHISYPLQACLLRSTLAGQVSLSALEKIWQKEQKGVKNKKEEEKAKTKKGNKCEKRQNGES